MSRWFIDEAEKMNNDKSDVDKYFVFVDGKNSVVIDLSNPPTKRTRDYDNEGQKTTRSYHDFFLLGVNEGKVLSTTDFLYSKIVGELKDNAPDLVGATQATLEIRKSHPDVDKTNWEVILKASK